MRQPDLQALAALMRKLDAPYVQAKTTLGGVAIEGRGRSAVALWQWLEGYLIAA